MVPSEFKWLVWDALKASVYMVYWVIISLIKYIMEVFHGRYKSD